MKDLSHILHEELEQIYIMLDILEVMHNKLKKNEKINLNDLKKIINYFKIFLHKSHHTKEEKILFPELQNIIESPTKHILKELVIENSLGETYLNTLNNFLMQYKEGNRKAKENLLKTLKKYINLEKKHIQKEEIFIIPICKQKMNETKLNKIINEMNKNDDDIFGKGMHKKFPEAFKKVISKLKKEYYSKN